MKRQRRKERKDHANQPGRTATGRGQETQEERIEGQSVKHKKESQEEREKLTVVRLEEKHGVGETFSEEHAEYDRIDNRKKGTT